MKIDHFPAGGCLTLTNCVIEYQDNEQMLDSVKSNQQRTSLQVGRGYNWEAVFHRVDGDYIVVSICLSYGNDVLKPFP